MALVLQDRVREISTTTGTGTVTLSGAYPGGYRTFASCVPNSSTTYYCIHNTADGFQTEWEVGLGTYSSDTLTRTTVLSSSNAGSLTVFSAGDKEVFITYPAEKAVFEQATGETILNNGPITVIGNNVTSFTSFGASLGEFYANQNSFAQLYAQNLNSGSNASTDIVAYNNQGDGTFNFVDMGICSSNYSEAAFPIFAPSAAYLYNEGGNLLVGSSSDNVTIFAGGVNVNSAVATFGTDLSTTLEGALNVGTTLNVTGAATFGNTVTLNANPTLALQATTKQYVDAAVATGFVVHDPVNLATVAVLSGTPTYNNGASGVGATLTAAGVGTLSVDGQNAAAGFRILVKNQANAAHNGVYSVTVEGTVGTPYVLTRTTDFDTASAGEIANNAYFFVSSGNTLNGDSFVLSQLAAITVGTTALPFTQFAAQLTYTGGTNINVSGTTISLDGTVSPTNGGTGVNTVTTGDLLYGSGTNTWSKLALGAANRSLVVNGSGTQVEWNAVPLGASGAVSGSLPATNGGTAQTTYTTGDTLYSSAANTLAKLAGNTSTTRRFLSQTGNGSASAAPAWNQPAASDITGLAASATTDTTNASNISSGTLANARTTAASANGASTIVARDASGNFAAGTITANLTGNVTGNTSGSAATLTTARNFQISGGATASNVSFDGSAAVNLSVTAMNASVINSGTIPNANTTASSSNGASTIVARDASGNFAAGTITATSISASGASLTALNASVLSSGTIPDARFPATLPAISGANLTSLNATALASGTVPDARFPATLPASSGANLTSLNASALASGTAPVARLATTGTPSASTFLRGDSSWTAVPSPNNGTLTMAVSGTGLSGSATFTADQAGASTFTVTSNATSANGASTIVARDGSGNFTANNIVANGDVTSSSDESLKTDWRSVGDDFVEKLAQVKSGVYTRIDSGVTQAGVGAQSLAAVLPEVTKIDDDGLLSVAYGQAALVSAVELAKVIVELRKEIELLKAK